VHYNLRKGGFSVTINGRVVANVQDITLTGPVRFQVEKSGPARIRRRGRREVVARADGVIKAIRSSPDITGMRQVTFNAERGDTFETVDDRQPIKIVPGGAVFAGAYAWIDPA
jgi:hypothetical protein